MTDRPPYIVTKRSPRRLALLTEGSLDAFNNKTAMCLLRYCPQDIVCVIDSQHAGMDLQKLVGVGHGIPIVATSSDAVKLGVEYLVIGVATPGGYLPKELRPQLYEAIRNRVGIISGLHESSADPNLASLAARHAVELINLRKVPEDEHFIATAQARTTRAFRVLTVGTDANIGKTTTTLNLELYLRAQNRSARFVATGQDGILIKGRGVCIDRVISDFAAGAVERLVLREADGVDCLLIEGQDGILSPCYGAVALSVLHGSCPDAMILCSAPARKTHRHTDVPIQPLATYVRLYEDMLAPLHPGKVVAISVNTFGLEKREAADAVKRASDETGLPAADPVREGEEGLKRLADTILIAAKKAGRAIGRLGKAGRSEGRGKLDPRPGKRRTGAA
jgi:uncharacterized NAD-dependent epimerase/dehydratase family protein